MVDSALTFLGNIFAGRSKTYKMILLLNKSNMTLAFMLLVLLVTARWYLKQHCVILYHKYKTYQNNRIKFWHIKKPSITDYLIWCTRDKSQKHVISLHWGNRLHAWEEWETGNQSGSRHTYQKIQASFSSNSILLMNKWFPVEVIATKGSKGRTASSVGAEY